MRQIPRYLIIGSIRIAQHTSYYLHLNTLKFSNWYRSNLCVMSCNFTTILWLKLFKELQSNFNISKETAFSYLNSIVSNLFLHYKYSLIAFIAPGDEKTIKFNLAEIKEDNNNLEVKK